MQTTDGRIIILGGKSRSGKTGYTARAVAKSKRVIAWDPEDQWAQLRGWRRITSQRELLAAIDRKTNQRIAYVASGDLSKQFDFFAGCAFFWGRYHGACDVIAEELADVTSTAKAPGNWGMLLRRGLKRGITIYAISQRWAEADKTAIGNASEFVCFSMLPMDVDYMAKKTGIPAAELAALHKVETDTLVICPYVRLIVDSSKIERQKLTFKK